MMRYVCPFHVALALEPVPAFWRSWEQHGADIGRGVHVRPTELREMLREVANVPAVEKTKADSPFLKPARPADKLGETTFLSGKDLSAKDFKPAGQLDSILQSFKTLGLHDLVRFPVEPLTVARMQSRPRLMPGEMSMSTLKPRDASDPAASATSSDLQRGDGEAPKKNVLAGVCLLVYCVAILGLLLLLGLKKVAPFSLLRGAAFIPHNMCSTEIHAIHTARTQRTHSRTAPLCAPISVCRSKRS